MKLKALFNLPVITLLIALGCNNDGVNSPTDEVIVESLNRSVLDEELTNAQNAGIEIEDVDALFSLGWKEFANPMAGEAVLRSEVFAVAPSQDSTLSPRLRGGLDMGSVGLSYGTESVELNKIEKRNGGIFYSLGRPVRHGRFGPPDSSGGDIPFIAGATYTFTTTGTESFPEVNVSITAPGQRVSITSPAQGSEVDVTSDLLITWSGGVADQQVAISVSAAPERGPFAGPGDRGGHGHHGDHGREGRGGGAGGDGPMGPGGFGPGIRILLDDNPGSVTVTADELQSLLADLEATQLRIHVMQIQTADFEQDGSVFAIHLRSGDGVGVQIAN